MEKYVNDIDKLRNEFYDKLVELYGEHYKWISVEIKMLEEKPKDSLTLNMNSDIRCTWKEYDEIKEYNKFLRKDMEGPSVENSGAIWDKSKFEKINS